MNNRFPIKLFFLYAAIFFLAVKVYASTAGYGFVFDDFSGILNAHIIASATSLQQAVRLLGEPWRALTQLSYALTINIVGTNPRAFHITNILIHALNSLLVFGIARHVAWFWMPTTKRELFPLAAASIHAVHPALLVRRRIRMGAIVFALCVILFRRGAS